MRIYKAILLTSSLILLSACGDASQINEEQKLISEYDVGKTAVGIPSQYPPQLIASGGNVEEIDLGDQNEFHQLLLVETSLGAPLLDQIHEAGELEVRQGYSFLQGWWTTPDR